jgi:hypothetical protein
LFEYPKKVKTEPWQVDVEERVVWAMQKGKERGMLVTGDAVVVVHGSIPVAGEHISLTDFHVRTVK